MVTVSALLAMAAHMEKKGVTVLDVAGLAQKNGAVYSHVRICDDPDKLHAVRLAAGGADVMLGCDMVVSGSYETLSKLQAGRTKAVVNGQQTMTADFTRDPDLNFPERRLAKAIRTAVVGAADAAAEGGGALDFVEATELAKALMGDTIGANLFIVGYAYQKGWLPVSEAALHAAIELNGVAPDFNKRALLWGRRAAHDMAAVEAVLVRESAGAAAPAGGGGQDLDALGEHRAADLTAYQNAAYAARYRDAVGRVAAAEQAKAPGETGLAEAAARALHKLMAYKDEYEVARLYTDGRFARALREQFEDGAKLSFHLAPPLFAETDPGTGRLRKKEYGAWVLPALRALAALKGLRSTAFDPFGYLAERKAERREIADYADTLETLAAGLTAANHETAVEIAELPLAVRGFGHVKEANRVRAAERGESLMAAFRDGGAREAAE